MPDDAASSAVRVLAPNAVFSKGPEHLTLSYNVTGEL
jgi:hypothetical protein